MARKTKEDAEKTRTLILASALDLFVGKGYEHTTFTDIAQRLKMTKGAVYWHFASKEELLTALIDLAFARFRRQFMESMPTGELTFPAVTEMLVQLAERVVSESRAASFFKLMKCQIRWTDASMDSVREKLMSDAKYGPKQAIHDAIVNDMRAGRIRAVETEEIATVVIAIWDGLVQAKIDRFLLCDLAATLRHSYAAIWNNIRLDTADRKRVSRKKKEGTQNG